MSNIKQIFKIGAVLLSPAVTYDACIASASDSMFALGEEGDTGLGDRLYDAFQTMKDKPEGTKMRDAFQGFCGEINMEESKLSLMLWLHSEHGREYREDLEFQAAIMESKKTTAGKSEDESIKTKSEDLERCSRWLYEKKRFSLEEIQAQTKAAEEILERLDKNPGVWLSKQDGGILLGSALVKLDWDFNGRYTFEVEKKELLTPEKIGIGQTAVLGNVGATCYFNSFFQLLVRVLEFVNAIEEYKGDDLFVWALKFFFQSMQEVRVLDQNYMRDFIETLQLFMPGFDFRQQQDVHELILILFDRLERAFRQGGSPTSCFYFRVRTEIFRNNGFVPCEESQPANVLLLPFPGTPKDEQSFTLEEMIEDRFAESEINDGGIDTQRREIVDEWPIWLLVEIERFKFIDGEKSIKINNFVDIPNELDLSQYSSGGPAKFRLVGIINHSGTLERGHYVIVVREGGQWIIYNDENRDMLPEVIPYISGMTPYMLLYRRKNSDSELLPSLLRPTSELTLPKPTVHGLTFSSLSFTNLGGSCFLNAALHCLIRMDPFFNAVKNYSGENKKLVKFRDFFMKIKKASGDPKGNIGYSEMKFFVEDVIRPLIEDSFPDSDFTKLEAYMQSNGGGVSRDVNVFLPTLFIALGNAFEKDGKPDPAECCRLFDDPQHFYSSEKWNLYGMFCSPNGKKNEDYYNGITPGLKPRSSKYLITTPCFNVMFGGKQGKVLQEMEHAGKKYKLNFVIFNETTEINGKSIGHNVAATLDNDEWVVYDDAQPKIFLQEGDIQKIQEQDPLVKGKLLENRQRWEGAEVRAVMALYDLCDS
ncbi:MAG: hypothetical protein LBG09_00925 [Puniceicoccales bacterium]|jgi:ubiquitin C-terminal hydrolase|nr:hypothetical protein [Puniceicoccales bacterium]